MSEVLKVIGLMSGTSLDGIDAALLETDGEDVTIPKTALTVPYTEAERRLLREAMEAAQGIERNAAIPLVIPEAERLSSLAHTNAVRMLLHNAGLRPDQIALVGFHGQTILHRPQEHWTWQIGDGAILAQEVGIDVICNFRSADVAAGGQGAPLAPLYHLALVKQQKGVSLPVAIVNIGGIANVTYISDGAPLAFDTGPGNALIDDWVYQRTGQAFDVDGALACRGKADERALSRMLANAYFDRPPPKSLDRLDLGLDEVCSLGIEDGAATLTAFTAAAIARAREHFTRQANIWIIVGGGRRNPKLIAELRARLNAPVLVAENLGWRGDFIEAEAFAYLAVRSAKGLPLTLPSTTGVPQPMAGGTLRKARG